MPSFDITGMPRPFAAANARPRWLRSLAIAAVGVLACAEGLASPDADRLVNLSARASTAAGEKELITGFVIAPGPAKPVLVRAVGPTLSLFGLKGLLANPTVVLRDSTGALVATNDNWSNQTGSHFSEVGAFDLPQGSLDAALYATLSPGAYTVETLGGSGLAIAEIYDVSGQARLNNLSARGFTDSGASVLIGGIVNSNTLQKRHVLVRGVGPGLSPFGISGFVADPVLVVYDGNQKIVAQNDDWDASLADAFSAAGAFGLTSGSKDAALTLDLDAGSYTVHMKGANNTSGVGLLEIYDLTKPASVFLAIAVDSLSTKYGEVPATFTVSRTGDLSQTLTVPLSISGTAVPEADYTGLPASVTLAPGATSVTLQISALASPASYTRTVDVSLAPTAEYALTGPTTAECLVESGESSLYLASLRPDVSSATSTASGSSVIRLSGDEQYLTINLSFANLSSSETVAYLRLVLESGLIADIRRLDFGQVDSDLWRISDVGSITAAQIVAGLKSGKLFVEVRSANFPAGELTGSYTVTTGSTTFVPPAAPPALPGGLPSSRDAARFLTQATFGPSQADIDGLTQKGFAAWIDEQVAKVPSSQRTETMADFALYPSSATATTPNALNRLAGWWKIALRGDDQLRQRVAFALSEILVISDRADGIANHQEAATAYYDMLAANAFGNFRDVIEKVSLSPMMGLYLSSLRNAKATSATGAQPDENYAREVMQLFTIGLWELQPDGTLRLDVDGLPIPTYNQTTITETAKVFTGWGYYSTDPKATFRGAPADYFNPMMQYPAFHDVSAKTIVGGLVLPAAQTGEQDLKATLDALFNHPSTAPFVSKKLIQRLVTSNPSPGYVYRVSQAFADDGTGTRGNLLAVIKAILLDYEARSLDVLANAGQGKLKEPVIRYTALTRAFNGVSATGRYAYGNADSEMGQSPLRSPTVFNFFEPTYSPPGDMAAGGVQGPEFQILNSSTAVVTPNRLYNAVYGTSAGITLDYTSYLTLASTPADLVNALDLVLCAGATSDDIKARLVTALGAIPKSTAAIDRVRMAAYLLVSTKSAAVQH